MNAIIKVGKSKDNGRMKWKPAWSYLPIQLNTTVGIMEDMTQRTYIRNNLNGEKIKLKFANLFVSEELVIEQITIGKQKKNDTQIYDLKNVTSCGKSKIVIKAGETFYSDEISLKISEKEDLVVSLYVAKRTKVQSAVQSWSAKSFWSTFYQGENRTMEQGMFGKSAIEVFKVLDEDENKATVAIGFSEVEVLTDEEVTTVALFGDSITHMSYFFDALEERLFAQYPGKITLMNFGIGGNRLLYGPTYVAGIPGEGVQFGKAGVERFEQNVYGSTAPNVVILLEGINDCTHAFAFGVDGEIPTAKKLEQGVENLIKIAHVHGSKIYIGTVMPFGCFEEPWREKSEKIRLEFNGYIREQKLADGIVDFDYIVKKVDDVHRMRAEYHLGDGIHPGNLGGQAMADAIPKEWFEKLR